ncbi:MAG: amino acid-binding protein [Lachnospiraceae bacterium]|nr:amino acid-binding protein [Lachnospiraceae bacterium]
MFMEQLTVFIENREGRLEKVTEILAQNNINIVCLSLADTSEYGMLRMIVSNPEKAKQSLKEAGFSARLTDVLAVKLKQDFGTLNKLAKSVSDKNINIEYMYTLNCSKDDGAIIIKCSDITLGYEAVTEAGLSLVDPQTIYSI